MSRVERAKDYFKQGFNCAQAVALAFAEDTRLSFEDIAKIMQPFGGGLGRLHLTCGAVSGMGAVVGLLYGKAEPEGKKETYAIVQDLCGKFKEKYGSLICADLLKAGKHPCVELVATCVEILEEYMESKGV